MRCIRKVLDNVTPASRSCSGNEVVFFGGLANLAIGLLFLQGAKLSREAVVAGHPI